MGYQAPYERIDWTIPRTDEEWTTLAAELRDKARDNRQSASDSFDRCDTDGFMSQWADGLTARAYECAASIAEEHGWIEVKALFTLDGHFLTAELRASQNYGWGMYWDVPAQLAAKHGLAKRYVNDPTAGSPVRRAKTLAKKGVAIGILRVRPYVTMAGSNATNVSVVAWPDRDALENGQFEVVRTSCGDLLDTTKDHSDKWFCWTPEDLAAKLA